MSTSTEDIYSPMKPPACPVDEDVRRWVEARMQWLVREFGEDRLRSVTVVTPTTEFFPGRWKATQEAAEALAERIAGYMGLDFREIDVYAYDNPRNELGFGPSSVAAGLFQVDEDGRFAIGYDVASIEDPLQLAATFAHELAHVHLLGHDRVDSNERDHELLTDLCCVFLGMGVIVANSGVYEKNLRRGNYEAWEIGRMGYLDLRTFGYAFAVLAQLRGEEQPEWANFLRLDIRSTMRKGLKRLGIVGLEPLAASTRFVVPASLRDRSDPYGTMEEQNEEQVCQHCGAEVGPPEADAQVSLVCENCRTSIDDWDRPNPMLPDRIDKVSRFWERLLIVGFLAVLIFGFFKVLWALAYR